MVCRNVFLPSVGVLLLSSVLPGCSDLKTTPDPASETVRELPSPQADDVVQIAEASRQYLVVETAGAATGEATVGAPAHVEFRDGAVSQVGAPLDGRVMAVHVRTGEVVRAGSALVTLDCPDAAVLRAAVETANVSLRAARAALEREQRMLGQGVGIERDKLMAESRLAEVQAELARAEAGAAFVGPGAGTTVVVLAPRAGTVMARAAADGMIVQQGSDTLVEIGDASAIWVVADVFERDLAGVRAGALARATLPSLGEALDGRVVSIGTVVMTGLRTAPVRIAVSRPDTRLRPGMFGRADITVTGSTEGLTLPIEAVLIKGKESVVFVERNATTYERRLVEVSQPVNGRVSVISGLAPGDRVVVKGALLLDGSADQVL